METFAEDLLEFLESTSPEGVDLEEAVANATAKFKARLGANKKVGKRLSPSKYLKKYGASWQNLKNETELEGSDLLEGEDKLPPYGKYSVDYQDMKQRVRSDKAKAKKESVQAKKDFVKAAWERRGVITTPVKEEVERIVEDRGDDDENDRAMGFDRGVRHFKRAELRHELRHDAKKPVKISTKQPIGTKISDIGAGGKEVNVRTDAEWDKAQAKKKSVEEAMERIAELSSQTLSSYTDKAKVSSREHEIGRMALGRNRQDTNAIRSNSERMHNKRKEGIATAASKMSNESVEQIDELSRKTLGSYIKKSSEDIGLRGFNTGFKRGFDDTSPLKDVPLVTKKELNRQKGVDNAVGKLTKEEVEQIDELKNTTMLRAFYNRSEIARKHRNDAAAQAARVERPKENAFVVKNRKLAAKNQKKADRTLWHMAGKNKVDEEVTLGKGTKKDKRSTLMTKELPTMPSGMNAGMRMMPEAFLAEISKDTVYAAYKERYNLAKAHDTVGNKKEAQKNAYKALKHADTHDKYHDTRKRYATIATARAEIAKRAKKDTPKAEVKKVEIEKPSKKGGKKAGTPATKTEE